MTFYCEIMTSVPKSTVYPEHGRGKSGNPSPPIGQSVYVAVPPGTKRADSRDLQHHRADPPAKPAGSGDLQNPRTEGAEVIIPLLRSADQQAPVAEGPGHQQGSNKAPTLSVHCPKWHEVPDWVKRIMAFGFMAVVNVVSMFLSTLFLHIATYQYVNRMSDIERGVVNASLTPQQREFLVNSGALNETLHDPVAEALGYQHANIKILDLLSASLPVAWLCVIVYRRDLYMWTKVILCNSGLAICKGILGFITIVPDSAGWKACKSRLGDHAAHYFDSRSESAHWLSDLIITEFIGETRNRLGSGMRYCADMMYSGHTYFTCLYGLALAHVIICYPEWPWTKGGQPRGVDLEPDSYKSLEVGKKRLVKLVLVTLIVALLASEIVIVLRDRFHYSMDIFVAILVTWLWYTNNPTGYLAECYTGLCPPSEPSSPCCSEPTTNDSPASSSP